MADVRGAEAGEVRIGAFVRGSSARRGPVETARSSHWNARYPGFLTRPRTHTTRSPANARVTIKSRYAPRLPHGRATRRHDVESTNTARRFTAASPSGGRRRLGS